MKDLFVLFIRQKKKKKTLPSNWKRKWYITDLSPLIKNVRQGKNIGEPSISGWNKACLQLVEAGKDALVPQLAEEKTDRSNIYTIMCVLNRDAPLKNGEQYPIKQKHD